MEDKEEKALGVAFMVMFGGLVFEVLASVGIGCIAHSAGVGCLVMAGFVLLNLAVLVAGMRKKKREDGEEQPSEG